ncbi:MAG: glycerol-3-phosphate 1-O-acyltransferase PlsY [Ruminococcaceae bacterium]|nr:glycerol-3-phosphate 1-O-acyltransferase PlsY [Oscillospiraceae bacterium]
MLKTIMYDGIFGYFLAGVEKNNGMFILLFALGVIASIVLPYLLGSVNCGILISNVAYHDDIRKYGSGNAGSTNMLRTYGKKMAAMTFVGDFAKGILGVLIGRIMFGVMIGAYIGGLFCVLGHIFPCYYNFKGGKGVATTAGMILMTNWKVFLVLIAIFVLLVYMTKYISFGSVMSYLMYPLLLSKLRLETDPSMGILIAAVIMCIGVFMHRANIKRIFQGTENKLSFKVKDKKPETEEERGENDDNT